MQVCREKKRWKEAVPPAKNEEGVFMEKRPVKKTKEQKKKAIPQKSSGKSGSIQINSSRTKRLIAVIFVVLLLIIIVRGIFNIVSLKQQEKDLAQTYQEKVEEKEKLEKMREYISSDEYIEQTARDLFKMVKPGEILYILEDEETDKKNENVLEKKEIVVPDQLPEDSTTSQSGIDSPAEENGTDQEGGDDPQSESDSSAQKGQDTEAQ